MAVKIEGMAALQANIRKLANQVAPKAAAKMEQKMYPKRFMCQLN